MMKKNLELAIVAAALSLTCGVALAEKIAPSSVITGPTSSQSPYVLPIADGVVTKSLLTVGDSVNNKPDGTPYVMVGIPDGLGAYDNGDKTFTVLMNHELREGVGAVRAHGAAGAFVSKWTLRKSDLAVLNGEDLIQNIATFNSATDSYNAPAKGIVLKRLCSADLPALSAFYNKKTRLGYDGRLFMNGEETGDEGRAFAHDLTGISYELPYLGKFSWENSLANPATGDKTVVVGTDDTTPRQVYVYIGDKKNTGNPAERAGLNDGVLYGVKVSGIPLEIRETGIADGTPFTLASFGDVSDTTGAQLQAQSVASGVTQFLRPEDGHWDTKNPTDFYFVTTDRFDSTKNAASASTPPGQIGRSRLWRLRFRALNNIAAGGTIDMMLDGTERQQMMDMTIDDTSRVAMIQEDPGNQPYLAKIHQYNGLPNNLSSAQRITAVAEHDPNRFLAGAPNFLTQDEESSGIIDISEIVGLDGTFLFDVQAHYPIPGELVEGGQLVAMYVPPLKKSGETHKPRYKKPFPNIGAR